MTGGVAAVALATALLAQQTQPNNPFLGSVGKGTVTSEPLKLSAADAVQRALQANLGLLLPRRTRSSAPSTCSIRACMYRSR